MNMIENVTIYYPFTLEITTSIEERKILAAIDASVKEDQIGGLQIITDLDKKSKLNNKLYDKEQNDSSSGSTEIIVLIELITMLE